MASSSSVLSVSEAQKRILAGAVETDSELVSLEDAFGRIIAEPLIAKLTQPPFSASAMDGYAVIGSDVLKTPVPLRVIGESAAGHGFSGTVESGQAVRIFTGAPLPKGADAIVIQENVITSKETPRDIVIISGLPDANHIRPRGGDFSKGDVLMEPGATLTSRHLTLAASMGYGTIPVRQRPVVAILSTGDELVRAGVQPGVNQIVASNGHGLAGIVKGYGGQVRLLGIASDTRESLKDKIQQARGADVLVTIGGASVGDHDLVGPVLKEAGMDLDFWKIAMRPGKPLLFGRLGKQRIIGVPGNPVSALICARVFLVPLLRALLGIQPALDQGFKSMPLGEEIGENGPREHYMRAIYERDHSGCKTVIPLPNQDSSLMVPFVRADCLIVRPAGAPQAGVGENVTVLPLDF